MDPPPDCTPHYLNVGSGFGNANSLSLVGKEREELKDKQSEYLKIGPKRAIGYSQNGGSVTKSTDSTIRSSAVVTYSAAKNHAMYSTLAPETNLNLAPSNWLRKTVGLRPETLLPGGRYATGPSRPFGGFSMAGSHLNKVGDVDVVSDAENIKKLLKMPYSKAHVSMAIHRIGRTLLLENFDIRKYTAEGSEWEWFRKFYKELVQKGPEHLLKKKSPESQYDRLMLSKFLYYSIHQDKYGNKIEGAGDGDSESDESRDGDEKLLEVLNEKLSMGDDENRIEELPSRPTSPEAGGSSVDSTDGTNQDTNAVVAAEKRWRYWTPGLEDFPNVEGDDTFERNISWTFEDLQMLLGTNMPIFGGGKYPAVSLRLRDSNKPINILTGIDYWLDNLICNVPELVMCFHVNGIVQNYEVIKTEDIPNLGHSSFSPQVIKDIAQNILSFLKSNCTKEGHTYWLFKGSGDDVVKLYDLTTLCNGTNGDSSGNKSAESQQNPYIFSVAMLLYKTAINLMQSKDTCDHHLTVKKLLGHCIDLLDHSKYQYVVSSAVCMLSTLYLPEPGLENAEKKEDTTAMNHDDVADVPQVTDVTHTPDCDTCRAHQIADLADLWAARNPSISDKAEVASIPHVRDLSIPDRYQKMSASLDLIKSPPCIGEAKGKSKEQAGVIEEDCRCALTYIVYGLRVVVQDGGQVRDWREDMLQQLFRNTTLAYFRLAEQASNLGQLGSALRRTKLALESYETYLGLLPAGQEEAGQPRGENQMLPPDFHLLLPRLLSLCGEIQFAIMQDIKMRGEVGASHSENYAAYTVEDREIRSAIEKIGPVGKYSDLTQFLTNANDTLVICMKCYNTAVAAMRICRDGHLKRKTANKGGKRKNKQQGGTETKIDDAVSSLTTTLFRRHGHVANEIGACALNEAVQLLDSKEKPGSDELLRKSKEVWARASSDFADAFNSFSHVGDVINQALVVSNIGRLMRISAQFHANTEEGQLSDPERHYFNQAIQKYSKALALLDPKEEKRLTDTNAATFTAVYDNISWELSSCYFSMAQIIQDNAPRDKKASDDAEKEVITLLTKSLKYCQDIWAKIPKQTLALYRQSKIHYRMASLHHNAYKHCTDSHRCRNLRNLADKHYEKSLVLLEGLENPNEWIRVCLERLALREHYISHLGSSNQKIKVLTESLSMMGDCIKPLQMIEKSTQVATKDSFSSRVDAREQSLSTPCDVDVAGISECSGLLRIMTIILQSFLRTLVKLTTATANTDKGVRIASKSSQVYKELYSRTLRALQPLKTLADEEQVKVNAREEGALTKLQENVSVVIGVLKDVLAAMAK